MCLLAPAKHTYPFTTAISISLYAYTNLSLYSTGWLWADSQYFRLHKNAWGDYIFFAYPCMANMYLTWVKAFQPVLFYFHLTVHLLFRLPFVHVGSSWYSTLKGECNTEGNSQCNRGMEQTVTRMTLQRTLVPPLTSSMQFNMSSIGPMVTSSVSPGVVDYIETISTFSEKSNSNHAWSLCGTKDLRA